MNEPQIAEAELVEQKRGDGPAVVSGYAARLVADQEITCHRIADGGPVGDSPRVVGSKHELLLRRQNQISAGQEGDPIDGIGDARGKSA